METSASRQEDGNTAFWLYGVCSGGDGQRELVHAVSSASLRALGASHFLQKLLLQFSPKPSWQSRCATPRPSHPSPTPATTAPYAVRLALVVHLTCHATRHGYASSVPTRPPPKAALARTLAHALPRRSLPEHSGCAPTPPPPSPRPTPASSGARQLELSSTAGRSDLPPKSWSLKHRRYAYLTYSYTDRHLWISDS